MSSREQQTVVTSYENNLYHESWVHGRPSPRGTEEGHGRLWNWIPSCLLLDKAVLTPVAQFFGSVFIFKGHIFW